MTDSRRPAADDDLRLSPEVRDALAAGRPVVALESTVLAHGLPRPRNLEVGRMLEAEVRATGAVPATIAVLGGRPTLGLSPEELEHVANAEGVLKLSTRDLPLAVARGLDGATTVAATAWIAHRAGIHFFATGGIGGVHRGAPLDVSADLLELSRTPIVVVAAGAKSILDLPATREALESAGVLLLGWQTDEMPGFYSATSGLSVDARVETAEEAAGIWQAKQRQGVPGSVLLCAPPPAEHALPEAVVERAIAGALAEAERVGVRGRDVTPFLLRAVAEATGGDSLEANVALLRNNVRIASAVAVAAAAC